VDFLKRLIQPVIRAQADAPDLSARFLLELPHAYSST